MTTRHLFVIDARLPDQESLIAGLPSDSVWMRIDSHADGLAQIAEAAANYEGLVSIHLLAHGQPGALLLGSSWLTPETVSAQATTLARIGESLADDGDILLYGCETGAGTEGQRLIEALAAATGADVAASTDSTGAEGLGGNWALEQRVGVVSTEALDVQAYTALLTTTTYPGLQGEYAIGEGAPDFSVLVTGPGVSDTLTGVDTLAFADATVNLAFNGVGPGEFRVNTYINGGQAEPTVAALAGGGWIVSWLSVQNGDGWGIYAQRYGADGTPIGGEFRVNTYTGGSQDASSVAALADGGWVVSWSSNGQDGSGFGIYALRYAADGAAVGAEVQINTYTSDWQYEPSVASLVDGGWIVSWSSIGQDGSGSGIYARRYGANGTAVGSEVQVNTYTSDTQYHPSVVALNGGGWIVSWASDGQDGSYQGIYAQRYGVDGAAVGAEFRVNAYTSNIQFRPSAAALADGGWVISWTSMGQDGSDWGIYAQHYASNGMVTGAELQVNTYTSSSQYQPSVAALADGGWIVAWNSYGQDGTEGGIYAQRYGADGVAVGAEFQVNTYTSRDQYQPSVAALADGGWIVSWAYFAQNFTAGHGSGIYAQRYNAEGQPVGALTLAITGDDTAQSLLGSASNDTITALAGDDTLDGAAGADSLIGGTGNDTYLVDDANDIIVELPGEGTDLVTSTATTYTLGANLENLTLSGTAPISGTGNSDPNTLVGNFAANTLDGAAGADTLRGGAGDDTYRIDDAGDTVIELAGEGRDLIVSTIATTLPDNVENLTLLGTGPLAATGNALANVLTGDSGDNTLTGGLGDDTLRGAEGSDTARYSGAQGDYTITSNAQGSVVVSGPEGVDTLSGIEKLQFADAQAQFGFTGVGVAEFRGNTYFTNDQLSPSVAALPDGGWIATWQSNGGWNYNNGYPTFESQDGSGSGIYGQRYSADGSTVGSEFRVNIYTSSDQSQPSVTALTGGGWVVSWSSSGQDGSGYGIYAQRYGAEGAAAGAEVRVNTYTSSDQSGPSVAALVGGGWVVSWSSYGQDGSGYGIYAQRYGSDGASAGSEFRVNTYTSSDQYGPSVAALADGGWVVSWSSGGLFEQDGSGSGIYAQRYGVDGAAAGTEFRVNTRTSDHQSQPAVTALAGGGWIVSWSSSNQDGSGWGIYAQRYGADGAAVGTEFRVNTYTYNSQDEPSMAALAGGGWVVSWSSYYQDGSDRGIYAQRYGADGSAIGAEFRVNTYTNDWQYESSVTALADGGWVVSWSSSGQDGSGSGIYAQRYNAAGQAIGALTLAITGNATAQLLLGSSSNDTITALAGDDTLDGAAGADSLIGGNGNDTYLVDDANDIIVELPGEGADLVTSTAAAYTLGANLESLTLSGTAPISGTGNSDPNTLIGNSAANTLDGAAGADTLRGGTGDDTYRIDDAGDTIIELAGEGTDLVVSIITTTLPDNVENLTLSGTSPLAGTGNALANILRGNSSNNTLTGGLGDDTLRGAEGSDTARYVGVQASYPTSQGASDGAARVAGPEGTDTLFDIESLLFADATATLGWEGIGSAEIRANTFTTGSQGRSAIAVLADGGWVITWSSADQDGSGWGCFGQRFNAAGQQIGREFQVNTYVSSDQVSSVVVPLADGGWLATWRSWGQDGSAFGVYTKRFDAAGNAADAEFRVNSYTTSNQDFPSTAALSDGGWVSVWMSEILDGSSYGIYGRQYNAAGQTTGEDIRVNTFVSGSQSTPNVAALAAGGWVVVWQSALQDGSGTGIYGQRFGTNGSPVGTEFRANTFTASDQTDARVAALTGGGWVITWTSNSQDGSGSGVYAQRYAASGATEGSEFRVNSYTADNQSTPCITGLQDGGWVVAWESAGEGGEGKDIYAQRYNASGEPRDAAFRVNTYTAADQSLPSIAPLANGGWLISWTSGGQDGSAGGVFTQRYNAAGQAVGSVTLAITGDSSSQLLIGASAQDTIEGLAGNDTLDGGTGADQMIGGAGDDVYYVNQLGDAVIETTDEGEDLVISLAATHALANHVERLTLAGSADINGTGNALANRITGNSGSNQLDGGAGADTLIGGAGDDVYLLDQAGDQIEELADGGIDEVIVGFTYTLAATLENLTLAGISAIDGTGNASANRITGNAGRNILDGGSGADTLAGGGGDDTYQVDTVDDVVIEQAGEGLDTVVSAVSYQLTANVEVLVLGGSDPNAGTGNALANRIEGNGGANTLDGLQGADTLIGHLGNDTYLVDDAGDEVVEVAGEGIDEVRSNISYTLARPLENLVLLGSALLSGSGNSQANMITGNAGANILSGWDGDDTIAGVGGSDTLSGGYGNDQLTVERGGNQLEGGAGMDTFVFRQLAAYENAITDFTAADTIRLEDIVAIVALQAGDGTATAQGVVEYEVNGERTTLLLGLDANAGADALIYLDGFAQPGALQISGNTLSGTVTTSPSGTVSIAGTAIEGGELTANLTNLINLNTTIGITYRWQQNVSGTWTDIGLQTAAVIAIPADQSYVGKVIRVIVTTTAPLGNPQQFISPTAAIANANDAPQGNVLISGSPVAGQTLAATASLSDPDGNGTVVYQWQAGGVAITAATSDVYTLTSAEVGKPINVIASYIDGYGTLERVTSLPTAAVLGTTPVGPIAGVMRTGSSVSDNLTGGGGNDTLDGAGGNDTLAGGLGDDTYVVNSAGDVITELPGEGTDLVKVGFGRAGTYTLSDNLENATITGTLTRVNVTGNALANRISGNAGANKLIGDDGDDTLNGAGGIDTLLGGRGDDTYTVDVARDVITELAGEGTDLVQVNFTASGTYVLSANLENATITGTSARVNVTGNTLANRITGNAAANKLIGGDGNDTLIGGLGTDTLDGGAGNDKFVFNTIPNSTTNRDTITSFISGLDTLQLSLGVYQALGAATGAIDSASFVAGAAAADAGDRLIYNKSKGLLLFDSDGTGPTAAIEVALIANKPSLVPGDIQLID